MKRAALVLVSMATLLLRAQPAHAQLTFLQNDDFPGSGPLLCYTGLNANDEGLAAKFTATPSQYPYTIDRIRVFGCGGGQDIYFFAIYHDDGGTANPGPLIYQGQNGYVLNGTNVFNDILLSDEGIPPIVVTSGS